MNSMKRQKDMTLKDELPRLEGVHMLLEKSREIIPERPKLLLLLSRFSCVRLCATPWMAAYQAPPSLGFSRQEHWSGLPFPSPVHESVKWKWGCSVVSNSLRPHRLQPTRLLRPWDFPGKNTGETGPKWTRHPAVDVFGGESKIQCCKEQYCKGIWNVSSTNQGKLEVVKEEMARVNIDNFRNRWSKMDRKAWI